MKTIIAGCPTLQSYQTVVDAMESADLVGVVPTRVITPNSIGIGILGAKWAEERRIACDRTLLDFDMFGDECRAVRNLDMVRAADALVLIVNKLWFETKQDRLAPQFNDTGHLLEAARAKDLQVVVWEV